MIVSILAGSQISSWSARKIMSPEQFPTAFSKFLHTPTLLLLTTIVTGKGDVSLNDSSRATVPSVDTSSHTINSLGSTVWARILSSCSLRYTSPLHVHMATEIVKAISTILVF